MKVWLYQAPGGGSPVQRYLDDLEGEDRARIFAAILRIEATGVRDTPLDFRQIEGKLWELKISSQRLFYVLIDGPAMMVLHGYKKQGQKAPKKEIALAKARMKEVLGNR